MNMRTSIPNQVQADAVCVNHLRSHLSSQSNLVPRMTQDLLVCSLRDWLRVFRKGEIEFHPGLSKFKKWARSSGKGRHVFNILADLEKAGVLEKIEKGGLRGKTKSPTKWRVHPDQIALWLIDLGTRPSGLLVQRLQDAAIPHNAYDIFEDRRQ